MSGEKTEQPTSKRLKDAREKGQVLKSQDVTQAVTFIVMAAILASAGGGIAGQLRELLRASFRPELFRDTAGPGVMLDQLSFAMGRFLSIVAPVMLIIAMTGAAVVFFQVKPLFSTKVIQPKFDKLNPISGLQNIFFQPKTYVELAKNLLKLIIVLVLAYLLFKGSLREIIVSAGLGPAQTGALAGELIRGFLLRAGAVFVLIGGADYMLQKKFYMKNLMMSKEEVKQEYKQDEGDPHIKHQRRHLAEEMILHGAAAKVPKADVVVVNPVHLAIALEYDREAMGAPVVTAKGREEMAATIRDLAGKHGVPILENIPLAHSLYVVELGTEIPEDLYEAVAEVLNWVYELRREVEQ